MASSRCIASARQIIPSGSRLSTCVVDLYHSLNRRNSPSFSLQLKVNSNILYSFQGGYGTRQISTSPMFFEKARMSITFIKPDGERVTAECKEGESILDVVNNNNMDLIGYGACEGTRSCSTCHVIFKPEDFERIGKKATDEELDMLDMAYFVTPTSRLGCQVRLTKALDGVEITIPNMVRDAREPPSNPETD